MLLSAVLAFLLVSSEASPVEKKPDKLFESIIEAFNELFVKPNSMPKVRSLVRVDVGNATVSFEAVGLYVEGEDFQRVGASSTYSKGESVFYKTDVTVGGLRFTYNNVNVQIDGKTYNAAVRFPSYRTRVPFIVEKSPENRACAISTGPFTSDLSETTLEMKTIVEDKETKEIIRKVQKDETFISALFLDAFFSAAQDPIFLLVKQEKLCECLVGIKSNC